MDLAQQITEERDRVGGTDLDVIGTLFQEMDAGQDFVSGNNNYTWFFAIGRVVRPRVITEMGSRFGYSMKCFVEGAGHSADEYLIRSFDAECDGIRTLDIFQKYFKQVLGIEDIIATLTDTRELISLEMDGKCDLVMVDANHTAAGCLHECCVGWEALRSGGVLVVDDTNYPEPAAGLEQFSALISGVPQVLPSLRGISLLIKP